MARTSVGIIRGGTSSEYDLSLKTGAAMLAALPDERYDARDILIDRTGMWYLRGMPTDPARAIAQIDVALNALHGGVGEDGSVQRILERAGVPYAGARPLAAALSLHKGRGRDIMQREGVTMPRASAFTADLDLTTGEMAQLVFVQFGPPYIVKPALEGAGNGIRIADTLLELPDALGDVLDAYGSALVEEYVRGHDVSVGLIEDFRGEELYALPPVHVIAPQGARFIGPDTHHQALLSHVVPSNFSSLQKQMLVQAARAAHRSLRMGHFSRIDLMLTPRAAYVLEVNATPGLYPGASFVSALESVGSSVREFLEHAIQLARA